MPLFKLLWAGAVYIFNGSYFAMILLLWITHFINVVLFGRLLLRSGFSQFTALFVMILFGTPSINIETLGWSLQWSTVISLTFFLIAAQILLDLMKTRAKPSITQTLFFFLTVTASALCLSRGVLTGVALAFICFMNVSYTFRKPYFGLALAILATIPALTEAGLVMAYAPGSHQHILDGGHGLQMVNFALHYFILNPLFHLFSLKSINVLNLVVIGLLKIVTIVYALFLTIRSSGDTRTKLLFLILLLLYDLGNSALLGVGRYHTGIGASISSRYQYVSLLCFTPFLAIVLDKLLSVMTLRRAVRFSAQVIVLVSLLALIAWPWKQEIRWWAGLRGTEIREALKTDPDNKLGVVYVPWISVGEAKELIQKFNLH